MVHVGGCKVRQHTHPLAVFHCCCRRKRKRAAEEKNQKLKSPNFAVSDTLGYRSMLTATSRAVPQAV